MSIEDVAAQALAERRGAMRAYDSVRQLAALEELRAQTAEPKQQRVLDLVLLERRRQIKADGEVYDRLSDLFDKASLPAAAALPVFVTLLASERLLVDPLRQKVLLVSYLFGGVLWLICRWYSYRLGVRAKRTAALLGKVD